jgi:integrase
MLSNPTGALVIREEDSGPFYEAKWRRRGRQVKRRIGGAWLTKDRRTRGWKPRRGRAPDGYFDEKRATVRMAELIAEHESLEAEIERGERERNEHGITVRELAAEWLRYVEHEKGAKPSTLREYRYMIAEPGAAHGRGPRRSEGRIMKAFGDRRVGQVTTRDVASFLRGLDRLPMGARNINRYRGVLSAMFAYACREDTYGLPRNPVSGTNKRREPPPAVLDFYEPEEIEALARAAADGAHRPEDTTAVSDGEREWREWEDHQDAELYRVAAYTGLRMGELLALRWEDVDLDARRMIVHRAVSAGVEGPTKSWQARAVPLADPAAAAFARLASRRDYTARKDYVFCSRLGRRMDDSALRRRYGRARDAAGLRSLTFHALRHAAGSLVAREASAHFVQAFLGHSRLSTTERYLHAKSRVQDVGTLNKAFVGTIVSATSGADAD